MKTKVISKPIENITLYLNSAVNTERRTNGSKTTEMTFNISPIILNEYSVIKIISIAHTSANHSANHGNSVLSFRLGNSVSYNPELYRSNDNSPPVLFAMNYTDNEPAFWSNIEGIHISPQTINSITLILSDDLSSYNNGISNDLNFMIGLVFEVYDRQYSATEN